MDNNVEIVTAAEYVNQAALRLMNVKRHFSNSNLHDINKPYKEEGALLIHIRYILNMLGEYVHVARQDAKTISGEADFIVCFNGRFIALELKRNNGEESKPQEKKRKSVVAAGGYAVVVRTLSQVFDVLQLCLE